MKTLITNIICLLWVFQVQAQTKNVGFIHGLAGTAESWQLYDNYFNGLYQMNNFRPTYFSTNGVVQATQEINNQASAQLGSAYDDPSNFFISHSFGGYSTRYMDKHQSQTPFKGYITTGAPINGAELARSVSTGLMEDYIDNMVFRMMAGPLEDGKFGLAATVINLINPAWVQNLFPNGFGAQEVITLVDQTILVLFGQFGGQTAVDLNPASPASQELSSFQSSMPGLAFYGVEESPVHWRAISSMMRPTGQQELDGEYDEDLLQWVHLITDIYKGVDYANQALGLFHDFHFSTNGSRYHYLATLWRHGHQWINLQSEPQWLRLLGAGGIAEVPVSVKVYVPEIELQIKQLQAYLMTLTNPQQIQQTLQQIHDLMHDPANYSCWESVAYIPISAQPNDGIVTKSDCHRADLPEDRNKMIEHANHFELRNHENAREAYTDAFMDENSFFKLILQ